jgi:mycofactocin precursor
MPDIATDLLDQATAETANQDERTEITAGRAEDDVVAADLLVEEISIDGMCGVY